MPTVLRAGEQLASTSKALQAPNSKTYWHFVPGAKFIMPDGLEILFLGGQFTTADPEVIAQLDAIVDKPTSMIYSSSVGTVANEQLQKQAAASAVTA